jgi:hypothetical protein
MKENSVFSCSPTHASAWTRAEGWPASKPACKNPKTTADFPHTGVHLANVRCDSFWVRETQKTGFLQPIVQFHFGDAGVDACCALQTLCVM